MSGSSNRRLDDRDIRKLIEFLESEGRQLENTFENIDNLSRKVESLAEQIIRLKKNRGDR